MGMCKFTIYADARACESRDHQQQVIPSGIRQQQCTVCLPQRSSREGRCAHRANDCDMHASQLSRKGYTRTQFRIKTPAGEYEGTRGEHPMACANKANKQRKCSRQGQVPGGTRLAARCARADRQRDSPCAARNIRTCASGIRRSTSACRTQLSIRDSGLTIWKVRARSTCLKHASPTALLSGASRHALS
jgi:hypothetical protein